MNATWMQIGNLVQQGNANLRILNSELFPTEVATIERRITKRECQKLQLVFAL